MSADLPRGPRYEPNEPRKDYVVLAKALDATVLDRLQIARSATARAVARVLGVPVAQAWLAFRRRRAYDVVVTNGEHIGISLAILLKLAGARTRHVTIGHRISAPKKRPFFRWLKVHTHIDRMVLHATRQYDLAVARLGIPADRLVLMPYGVDTDFWHPLAVAEERLISSAGLEFRDYPTLFRAVDGLDARVVVIAGSLWSRRRNRAATLESPANVNVLESFIDYGALRDLHACSAVMVVPLDDVDFQAGVTTILEAMAMGKAVVVTHIEGQTDVVQDRRSVTRGSPPRPRPVSLLRGVAGQLDLDLEPNGFYVPPADPLALRRAIVYLLDNPEDRARLGAAGRSAVERLMTVDQFAERLRVLVEQVTPAQMAGAGTGRRVPRRR